MAGVRGDSQVVANPVLAAGDELKEKAPGFAPNAPGAAVPNMPAAGEPKGDGAPVPKGLAGAAAGAPNMEGAAAAGWLVGANRELPMVLLKEKRLVEAAAK